MQAGAIPVFVQLLDSADQDIQFYCAAAISNLAVNGIYLTHIINVLPLIYTCTCYVLIYMYMLRIHVYCMCNYMYSQTSLNHTSDIQFPLNPAATKIHR